MWRRSQACLPASTAVGTAALEACRGFCRWVSHPTAASPPSPLVLQRRCVFIREHRSPITIKTPDRSYPAVLRWRYRSDRPKHLVMSITRPPKAAMSASADILDEEAEGDLASEAMTGDSSDTQPDHATSVSYTFGRLFLRPYNVGQLLAVLQGWTQQPAHLSREHTSLTLVPVEDEKAALPLSAFRLTGTFTTKTNPRARPREDVSTTFDDDDGVTESTYNLNDVRTIELELKGSELMLLTTHLEAVLRDLFRLEHGHHSQAMRNALDRQRERLLGDSSFTAPARSRHYASLGRDSPRYQSQSHSGAQAAAARQDRSRERPSFHRPSTDVEDDLSAPFDVEVTAADSARANKAAAAAAVSAFVSASSAKAAVRSVNATQTFAERHVEETEEVEEVDEEEDAGAVFSVDEVASSSAKAGGAREEEAIYEDVAAAQSAATEPQRPDVGTTSAGEDEEEYEEVEVVEEVEEDDDEGVMQAAAPASPASALGSESTTASFGAAALGAAAATVTAAAATAAAAATRVVAAPAPASSASVTNLQKGEMEMESESRYTKARFVQGNNIAAVEVDEVGKAFGLDVVQNTKVASMTTHTAAGGAQTKGTAAVTSGSFRAEGGGLTGSYHVVHQRLETVTAPRHTVSASDEAAQDADDDADAAEEEEEVVSTEDTKPAARKPRAKRSASAKRKSSRRKKGKGKKSGGKAEGKTTADIEQSVSF